MTSTPAIPSGPIKIAILGVGKIATDQHIPTIRANPDFDFIAAASPSSTAPGVRNYDTLEKMLAAEPDLQAVSLCTPVDGRYDEAVTVLAAGRHVLLEKPPGGTVSEVQDLARQAEAKKLTLFATWHSRFAPAAQAARAWLKDKTVTRMRIDWRENVRQWHPHQDWIFEAGALGVFDPGVNALSLVTEVLPLDFFVTKAELAIPKGRQGPIHADLEFTDRNKTPMSATFDWLHPDTPQWEVRIETNAGALTLADGGATLHVEGGTTPDVAPGDVHAEYEGVYKRFAELLRSGASEVDLRPLQHAADAFLKGSRTETDAFDW